MIGDTGPGVGATDMADLLGVLDVGQDLNRVSLVWTTDPDASLGGTPGKELFFKFIERVTYHTIHSFKHTIQWLLLQSQSCTTITQSI